MWTQARITAYLIGLFGAAASLAVVFGWAQYDPETYMLTPAPFDVRWLAGQVAAVLAPALAAVAARLGWGRKQ